MTVKELSDHIRSRISGIDEARALERIIFEETMMMRPVDVVVSPNREVPPFIPARIDIIIDRLRNGEPIQYILGHTRFYGMELNVGHGVLIPRPETEQLVDIIVDRYARRPDLKIIDIGTGSGAIAISLGRTLKFPHITAVDLSHDALAIARRNATALGVDIDFIEADILDPAATITTTTDYDIVVSNPPYVLDSERAEMEGKVLDHEPALALFVPDSDPLRFYNAIMSSFRGRAGAFYFEINPLCASQFRGAEIVKDSFGKERFAIYDPA